MDTVILNYCLTSWRVEKEGDVIEFNPKFDIINEKVDFIFIGPESKALCLFR